MFLTRFMQQQHDRPQEQDLYVPMGEPLKNK